MTNLKREYYSYSGDLIPVLNSYKDKFNLTKTELMTVAFLEFFNNENILKKLDERSKTVVQYKRLKEIQLRTKMVKHMLYSRSNLYRDLKNLAKSWKVEGHIDMEDLHMLLDAVEDELSYYPEEFKSQASKMQKVVTFLREQSNVDDTLLCLGELNKIIKHMETFRERLNNSKSITPTKIGGLIK